MTAPINFTWEEKRITLI